MILIRPHLVSLVFACGLAGPWSGVSEAATAKSAEFADVNAAVKAAGRGETVRVPAGTANWGGNTLVITKGIKLMGAGRDNTSITSTLGGSNQYIISIQPDNSAPALRDEFRIEGFTFDGHAGHIIIDSRYNLKFVVGWNRFKNSDLNASVWTRGQTRGVIYKNEYDRCTRPLYAGGYGTIEEWTNPAFVPFAFGSAENIYFEDNYIHCSSPQSSGASGWIEVGQSGRVVVRYNTWDWANSTGNDESVDFHGFQGWQVGHGPGQTGSMVAEAYGNKISNVGTAYGGYSWMNHRGSWGLYFNNVATGDAPNNAYLIHASQYGHADNGGSGCSADVAAVDPIATGLKTEINNTYCFNNTYNGGIRDMTLNNALPDHCGIAEGTDFWNYNPSFGDGKNGIGRGTSAPTTTSNPDGAAYWVAPTAGPTTDPEVIQNGRLWKRIAGAWVDYYRPYTYPHPLRDGDPSTALAPPSNLRVVPH